ncbi:hypothetical protein ACJMK2_017731 [Sinanodonta woodiana]|uniref:Peptidase M12B domain-containing protein n=1 Tax=Sinanodonta woodiana TaxID=1069815 RepID=A0ABD3UET7_SINWO
MNDYRFIVLFCTVAVLDAGTSEFVWLRDLNNDAQKRHLDLGLSEELRFQLNSGKRSINLHLKENPHVRADTDVYVIKDMPDGTKRAVKEPVTGNIESKYYHDIENSAVFTVRCSMRTRAPCARTLEGKFRIGDKYFHISPVSDLSKVDSLYMNPDYQDTPHEIREEVEIGEGIRLTNDSIKLSDVNDDDAKKRMNMRRSSDNLNVEESNMDNNKRDTKVYGVELLVVVDPPVWKKFCALAKNDNKTAIHRVREYVAQVITGKRADGPYKNAKPCKYNGVWTINDRVYLRAFKRWVMNTPGLPSRTEIDNALMLSGYSFILTAGVAYLKTVCSNAGVSLITESGYIRTIILAGHVLAHNLGASHDTDVGCPEGNIMGMEVTNVGHEYSHESLEFSDCSIDAFEKFLPEKSCLKNKATFIDDYANYNTLYPGQMYNAEQQCKIAYGIYSYRCHIPEQDKVCVSLECYMPRKGFCSRDIAADGTQCGSADMWCIEGQCVSKQTSTLKPTTTTVEDQETSTLKPTTTTVEDQETRTPESTFTTLAPSCKDCDICKQLYEVYNSKKRFCSDLGELCCETCKGDSACEDRGFMDLTCADIRSLYSSKSKFCRKWSENCCMVCSVY